MTAKWTELANQFASEKKTEVVKVARRILQSPDASDWQWLSESLTDNHRKWFVAAIFRGYPVPKRLFEPFLQAAVSEPNPSLNQQFVEPCVKSYGHRSVNEYLLEVVESGDNSNIAGAVASLYWAKMQISFSGKVAAYTLEHATPESRRAFELLNDVWERKRATFLRVFVSNANLDVRRQIIPSLKLEENAYPESLKPLVQQAIDIAKNHSDEYIRHRLDVQLGNERLLQPLPERRHTD
ncbi:hypothetical protein [Rhodopirellula bahusiensis]|uniref:HEAT repeat domain-containing protein n=1 Tax=Rhodopirellula bahusiensis TaxID=2014065 RepID=A0A2G1W6X2_9BACT|nr:hypothetical protein [Rhodopirellula bahusiensis]PHQ34793.1 hypothetical protein CEE69_13030 [Rhodopirellula bahusiensis]